MGTDPLSPLLPPANHNLVVFSAPSPPIPQADKKPW